MSSYFLGEFTRILEKDISSLRLDSLQWPEGPWYLFFENKLHFTTYGIHVN